MSRLWIADRLKGLNKQKQDMAAAIGLPASRITELLNGKRKFQIQEIVQLAVFLEMEMGIVLAKLYNEFSENGEESSTEDIPVIGHLKKSKDRFQAWPSHKYYLVNLPRHHMYNNIQKFAIEESLVNSSEKNLYICIQEKDFSSESHRFSEKIEGSNIPEIGLDQKPGQASICNPPLRVIAHYRQSPKDCIS